MLIIATILVYFVVLFAISRVVGRRGGGVTAFFDGGRRSPWYVVAFGMVGASISGVTLVSVPGMPLSMGMTYLQTCLGFIVGYFAVAFVLLPVYYRFRLTTIYSYIGSRLGRLSYKTAASFFVLSKTVGASVRFFVVCAIMQHYVLAGVGIPFWCTVVLMVALIWAYTRRGGIRTLVWTDTFQTFCLFAVVLIIIYEVSCELGMSLGDAATAVAGDARSRIFVFDDPMSRQYFWKQFISGAFIVIVMTGLDQDMMQKNLTCKTLREARKDMCTYGFAFVPANLLLLSLGVLLAMLAEQRGIGIPAAGDDLLPMFAASGHLGPVVVVLFAIGMVAASFSSADSAMTALTTSVCVDLFERRDDERLRRRVHGGVAVAFVVLIVAFRAINSTSVIDAIYVLCSYTYGPLLGLFAFGLFTRRGVRDRLVPYIAVASPLLCFVIDGVVGATTGYRFGYELLLLNGALCFIGLYLSGIRRART